MKRNVGAHSHVGPRHPGWHGLLPTQYVQEMERSLKVVDCDLSSWRVLAILKEQWTSSVSEISVHAVAKLSTVTKIVYRMKADGLVTTATSPADARVTLVDVTEEGLSKIMRANDATHSLFERSLGGLTPGKVERLNEALRYVFLNLHGGDHPILKAAVEVNKRG